MLIDDYDDLEPLHDRGRDNFFQRTFKGRMEERNQVD
jgi:hypothetical protein